MRNIIFLILMVAILPTTWATDVEKINYPSEGDQAPNFRFEIEKGNTYLLSEYNNKIIYLVFFATWCPPCRKELPVIQKEIWEEYRNNDKFKLLVIGREHTHKELELFVTENHFTFPVIPDPKREIFSLFAMQNIPRSYLIDRNGKILKIMVGFDEKEFIYMKNLIEKELIN